MCDIDSDYDCYGSVSLSDRHVKKTRKETYCEECGRKIEVGKPSRYLTGIYDGDFFSMRLCRHCGKAADWLLGRGHAWLVGNIREDVKYCAEWELSKRNNGRTN